MSQELSATKQFLKDYENYMIGDTSLIRVQSDFLGWFNSLPHQELTAATGIVLFPVSPPSGIHLGELAVLVKAVREVIVKFSL